MKDNYKIMTALLAGLAAGVALGMLFAPEKGADTRDKLNDSLQKLGESIKDAAAEQIDQLAGLKSRIKQMISPEQNEENSPSHDNNPEQA